MPCLTFANGRGGPSLEPRCPVEGYTSPGFAASLHPLPPMRALALLALLSLAPAPSAAQAIIVPAACRSDCPPAERLRDALTIDSISVWANIDRGEAVTYVWHVIHNASATSVDGAFFYPLPRGATIERVMVYEAADRLDSYNEWSAPAESRQLLRESVRGRWDRALRAYEGMDVVHVRVPSIRPGGIKRLQIGYRRPLESVGGAFTYTYPLATMAAVAPVRGFSLGLTVKTPAGFADLRSPSHAVDVQWGTEVGRCPPQARCGFTSVSSRRVKVVRLEDKPDARTRDFVLVYLPAPPLRSDTTTVP